MRAWIQPCRGLLSVLALAVAQPAAALEATEPPTYDLTLEQALELARTRAPAVVTAQARVREARARLVGASVLLPDNPEVEVGGGVRVAPGGVSPHVEVGVSQVFELGGQRGARVDAASAGIERSSAEADEVARRASRATADVFLRARYAEERGVVAAEQERIAAELLGVAERRQAVGDVGALDVPLAALALARAQAEVRRIDVARVRAIEALRLHLGLEPEARVQVHGALLNRRRHDLAAALARTSERPGLRALAAAIHEADSELRLGEASAWPSLGVRLGYAHEEDAHIVGATLSIDLPLFDDGQGLEATARARAAALRVVRQAAEASARSEIRVAFAAYQRLLDAVEAFERDGLPRLEESESLARRAYESGAMKLRELLAVRRDLVDARLAHTDLILDAALAGVELTSAVGVSP